MDICGHLQKVLLYSVPIKIYLMTHIYWFQTSFLYRVLHLPGTEALVWTRSAVSSANVPITGLVQLVSRMWTSVQGLKMMIKITIFFKKFWDISSSSSSSLSPSFWDVPTVSLRLVLVLTRFSSIPGQGCQNGATCQNMPGTYQCHCTPGLLQNYFL